MLPEIHDTVRRLLYEEGRITPLEVDVRFEAPTREWVDRLTSPTINLFLFDLQENTDLRQIDFSITKGNGRARRRQVPRRIDLHYMVSALTTEVEDEHLLLWRTLAALMRNPEVPANLLPDDLRSLEIPVTARVSQPDESQRMLDVWGALGSQPHPALHYVVTAPLDLDLVVEAPLVLTRTARYGLVNDEVTEAVTHIGGTVRGKQGNPFAGIIVSLAGSAADSTVTNDDGQFTLYGVPAGAVTLQLSRPDGAQKTASIQVPSNSYEITFD